MTSAPKRPTLNIIGAGKVGRTLGQLWCHTQVFSVGGVMTRTPGSADAAVRFIGAGSAVPSLDALEPADAYLISVPDREIGPVAAALAARPSLPGKALAFHCSGALGSDELAPLAVRGWSVASAHPALSFADPARAVTQFSGCLCGIEGDPSARATLEAAFTAIGARCFALDADRKLLYHAGSVFASNFTTVLLDVALRAYRESGLDDGTAMALLEPLVRNAIDNSLRLGPAAALTGPAARGDTALVSRQAAALDQWDGTAAEAYRSLSAMAAGLAARARN